jgi:hypothetical protein
LKLCYRLLKESGELLLRFEELALPNEEKIKIILGAKRSTIISGLKIAMLELDDYGISLDILLRCCRCRFDGLFNLLLVNGSKLSRGQIDLNFIELARELEWGLIQFAHR